MRLGNTGSTQMNDDGGISYLADYFQAGTARFDAKLVDVGKPLTTATRQITTLIEGRYRSLSAETKRYWG